MEEVIVVCRIIECDKKVEKMPALSVVRESSEKESKAMRRD